MGAEEYEIDSQSNDEIDHGDNDEWYDEDGDDFFSSSIDADDEFWNNLEMDSDDEDITFDDEISRARASYGQLDSHINNFIESFVTQYDKTAKQKHKLKKHFFIIVMTLFTLVILTPIAVMPFISKLGTSAIIVSVLSIFGEILTSILILPKIVAQYLFNKEEDVATLKIVEIMQSRSEILHNYSKQSDF
jgi:hypothetical protein